MTFLALGAGIFLTLAMILREVQFARDKASAMAAYEQMRITLEGTRAQLRRSAEDLFVLQTVMVERHLIDDTELARSRARLIDLPRRRAEEKDAISRNLGVNSGHLLVDDVDGKIH